MELLSRSGITVKGKKAVVVGRSNIVGLPVSLLLLKADATVTIVHSHSRDPEAIIREADIIIAAAGQPMMVCLQICKFLFLFGLLVNFLMIKNEYEISAVGLCLMQTVLIHCLFATS